MFFFRPGLRSAPSWESLQRFSIPRAEFGNHFATAKRVRRRKELNGREKGEKVKKEKDRAVTHEPAVLPNL